MNKMNLFAHLAMQAHSRDHATSPIAWERTVYCSRIQCALRPRCASPARSVYGAQIAFARDAEGCLEYAHVNRAHSNSYASGADAARAGAA